jgi:Protein of unknown function (DUF1569)
MEKNLNPVIETYLSRVEKLHSNQPGLWGKMTVSQMVHHLNLAVGGGLGYYTLTDSSNWASRSVMKWLVLEVLQKFPRGTETSPPLKSDGHYDFDTEKQQLITILKNVLIANNQNQWSRHPYFGELSVTEWKKLIVIHVNHHLTQFGV